MSLHARSTAGRAKADRSGPTARRDGRLRRGTAVRHVRTASGLAFPIVLAALLIFLALDPIVFVPSERLTGTLASMVGAGLSFASVSFSAARVSLDRPGRAAWFRVAGADLLRFAIAMTIALTLATARDRLVTDFAAGRLADLALRGATAVVTVAGIGMAFRGFRVLVLLLGPEFEEDASHRLHDGWFHDTREMPCGGSRIPNPARLAAWPGEGSAS